MKKLLFLVLFFTMLSIKPTIKIVPWVEVTSPNGNKYRIKEDAERLICEYGLSSGESFIFLPENAYAKATLRKGDQSICPPAFQAFYHQHSRMICPQIDYPYFVGDASETPWCLYSSQEIEEWDPETEEWH
ncbi:TPA: hypothetical protein DIC20_03730 [Candidatus Dependentiae bacterium]|nr:MAG: hypothetical protein US03_C0001G0133 [candidate division TM6 bacterium GW2011_GWF2_36_131]KKQ03731.1 MAG: hypothetical protein US13_C0001G0071 [candidate division TM6 bacterium GW2011_GWE2_36_25]KKQ20033.1 MAG: hypothetical protein US32_C0002G0038 [candidate division TM6 bacterium GW2011_GWA2_36_9]HBR70498.1 hypothetical protein [Candidatus Dependentiae bacterium]HCU00786.1 hypothetical protein [Candidatus Dependentiae bacterium]